MNDLDRAVLDFEASGWWKYEGAKAEAIITRFGLSLSRYYQILNRLLSDPEAEARHPMTIRRLRRLRQHRAGRRA